MIDSRPRADPGTRWNKDTAPAVDVPPDGARDPAPEGVWSQSETRTGIYGAVTPRVLVLPQGGYRMYYTQILPRPGFPAGANDYDHSTTRILSAYSADGLAWKPEAGVRISALQGGAGEYRVVCGEIAPVPETRGTLRMYFECCGGPQSVASTVRSALSEDGLAWRMEPGSRMEAPGRSFVSPRIFPLGDGRCRLYCAERGRGIISALSEDRGSTFREEAGVRVAPGEGEDKVTAFAPEVVRLAAGGYRMYYAGYATSQRACILSALSDDGLSWRKETRPAIAPGGRWDGAKCSEMSVLPLPASSSRHRIFYEACDGTGPGQRGVWRIAGASAPP